MSIHKCATRKIYCVSLVKVVLAEIEVLAIVPLWFRKVDILELTHLGKPK